MNKEYKNMDSLEVSKTSTGKFSYCIKVYGETQEDIVNKMHSMITHSNGIINDQLVAQELNN